MRLRPGAPPRIPLGELTALHTRPLAGFNRPTSKGRAGKGRERKGKGKKGNGGK